jgi:hypothetical protein
MKALQSWLNGNLGSKWKGDCELWLDPEGNEATLCECSLVIEPGTLSYAWVYEGQSKSGAIIMKDEGVTWFTSGIKQNL